MPQQGHDNSGLWWRTPLAIVLGAVSGHFFRVHQLARNDVAGVMDKSIVGTAGMGVILGLVMMVVCIRAGAYRMAAYCCWAIAFGISVYVWK